MGKIDLTFAKNSFRRYLEDYDQKDPKIHLKKVHTFCVVEAADYICTQENRVGEIFSPLSHHRTCRSAYGGST